MTQWLNSSYNPPMATLHRMSDDQLPAVRSLLAQGGGTARTLDSWNHDQMTALLLGENPAAPTAVMPISRRSIEISPNRRLNVGWLSSNQFASKMSLRRQTRETYPDWPDLLPELDALLVIRRDEASLGARWYAQTGFHDVLNIRCLYLDMTSPPAPQNATAGGRGGGGRYHVQIASPQDATSWDAAFWQSEMLAVYRDVYASTGGPVSRHQNFWQPALARHYYKDHYQFQIIGLWAESGSQSKIENQKSKILMGYAVVGWSGWHSKRPRMDILELATRQWDTAVASELLHTTCQLAWSKNVHQVRAVISAHDPYRGHLTRSGFLDRWGYLMLAKWLQPQRHLDHLGQNLPPEIADMALTLSSPGQVSLTLHPYTKSGIAIETAPAADPLATLMQGKMHLPSANLPLQLQGDPRTLTRLLLQRLDITTALQDGSLFSNSAAQTKLSDHDITRLSLAFPWTPWVFHMLDYI